MTGQEIYSAPPEPAYQSHKSRIDISDVVLLTDGFTACSSAFIQFSPDCPHWAASRVARYIDKGWIKLKTAKIGETK